MLSMIRFGCTGVIDGVDGVGDISRVVEHAHSVIQMLLGKFRCVLLGNPF